MPDPKMALEEVASCALTHAFLRHPSHVRAWGRADGPLHVLCEILGQRMTLSFVPNPGTVLAYRAFASAELNRLRRRGATRLLCTHGANRHIEALTRLLNLLPVAGIH